MVKFVLLRGEYTRSGDIAEICQCSRQWVTSVRRRLQEIQAGMTVSQRVARLDADLSELRSLILEYLRSESRAPKYAREKMHLVS